MKLVFNASPIIVLAKADLLDRLLPLGNEIWIPQAVFHEVSAVKNPADPARKWLTDQSKLIHDPTPISPFVMAWDLGDGESAVLSLTESLRDAFAVLDDQAARHCAQAMGLKSIGTLGLILLAKRKGLITSARKALNDVIDAGLFISKYHIDAILLQADE
jgi:predicted nucleic acid-binding protein